MRKLITILIGFALMSFGVQTIIIRMTDAELTYHWQNLETTKQIIDKSTLPHNEAVFIIRSIDSLQKNILKSAKVDSVIKK